MPPRAIVPHRHAVDDVLDVVDYYREHAGTLVAEHFSFEVDQALERLSHHPKLKKPLRSSWDFCFYGLVTGSCFVHY